jgi:hypothetical protein
VSEGTNSVIIVCGPRGCGKTSRARERVRQALEEGRWVFAHDPLGQYKGLLVTYTSIDAWVAAVKAAVTEKKPMPRGAAFAIKDPLMLVDLVELLGERWNSAASAAFPMTVVFDESSMLAQGTWIDTRLNQLLAIARHRQIELLFLVQRKAQLSIQFWDMVTDAYLFLQPRGTSKDLEQPLCLAKGVLVGLEQLPKYHYVHVVQGAGPVAER